MTSKGKPMAIRKAEAIWNGTLKEGSGTFKGGSGALSGGYTYKTRFEEDNSQTQREDDDLQHGDPLFDAIPGSALVRCSGDGVAAGAEDPLFARPAIKVAPD